MFGEIGDGTSELRSSPAPITAPSATGWTTKAAGFRNTVAVRDNGTLWSWGSNQSSNLGNGSSIVGHGVNVPRQTIPRIPVTGLTLSPSDPTVSVGTLTPLIANVMSLNATNPHVTSWSSSNTNVATVGSVHATYVNYLTAHSSGRATIIATSVDGGFTAQNFVTVAGITSFTTDRTEYNPRELISITTTAVAADAWFENIAQNAIAGGNRLQVRHSNGDFLEVLNGAYNIFTETFTFQVENPPNISATPRSDTLTLYLDGAPYLFAGTTPMMVHYTNSAAVWVEHITLISEFGNTIFTTAPAVFIAEVYPDNATFGDVE